MIGTNPLSFLPYSPPLSSIHGEDGYTCWPSRELEEEEKEEEEE